MRGTPAFGGRNFSNAIEVLEGGVFAAGISVDGIAETTSGLEVPVSGISVQGESPADCANDSDPRSISGFSMNRSGADACSGAVVVTINNLAGAATDPDIEVQLADTTGRAFGDVGITTTCVADSGGTPAAFAPAAPFPPLDSLGSIPMIYLDSGSSCTFTIQAVDGSSNGAWSIDWQVNGSPNGSAVLTGNVSGDTVSN